MNLAAYDKVKDFDYRKPYIDYKYRTLYMSGVKGYPRYVIRKRFSKEIEEFEYYIVVTFAKTEDAKKCNYNNSGELRVNITPIINELQINRIDKENVSLELVEKQDDCSIYKLGI